MIRVLVVDDHPVVQGGLTTALNAEDDIDVVGVAPSIAGSRSMLEGGAVDVGLLDVRLADGSGFDLLRDRRPGDPAWIVLSSFDPPQYVARAVSLGASAYLLKTAPMSDVLAAIRAAAAGRVTFAATQLEIARAEDGRRLSRRERELVGLLVKGRSNDEIGSALGIQRKTVETYLTRLYQRLDCASRSELAARAVAEAWLED